MSRQKKKTILKKKYRNIAIFQNGTCRLLQGGAYEAAASFQFHKVIYTSIVPWLN